MRLYYILKSDFFDKFWVSNMGPHNLMSNLFTTMFGWLLQLTRPPTHGWGFTWDSNMFTQKNPYLSPPYLNLLFLSSSFFSLCLFPNARKSCSNLCPYHPGCDWPAQWGQLSAVNCNRGFSNCHLCDYTVGAVGSFLHQEDAAEPSPHVYLPIWIGEHSFYSGWLCSHWEKLFCWLYTVYISRGRKLFCSLTQELWPWHEGQSPPQSPSPIQSLSGRT